MTACYPVGLKFKETKLPALSMYIPDALIAFRSTDDWNLTTRDYAGISHLKIATLYSGMIWNVI